MFSSVCSSEPRGPGGMRHDVPSRPDPEFDRAFFDIQLRRVQRTEVGGHRQSLAGDAGREQPIGGHIRPSRVAKAAFERQVPSRLSNHERASDARDLDRHADSQGLFRRPTQLDQSARHRGPPGPAAARRRYTRPRSARHAGSDPFPETKSPPKYVPEPSPIVSCPNVTGRNVTSTCGSGARHFCAGKTKRGELFEGLKLVAIQEDARRSARARPRVACGRCSGTAGCEPWRPVRAARPCPLAESPVRPSNDRRRVKLSLVRRRSIWRCTRATPSAVSSVGRRRTVPRESTIQWANGLRSRSGRNEHFDAVAQPMLVRCRHRGRDLRRIRDRSTPSRHTRSRRRRPAVPTVSRLSSRSFRQSRKCSMRGALLHTASSNRPSTVIGSVVRTAINSRLRQSRSNQPGIVWAAINSSHRCGQIVDFLAQVRPGPASRADRRSRSFAWARPIAGSAGSVRSRRTMRALPDRATYASRRQLPRRLPTGRLAGSLASPPSSPLDVRRESSPRASSGTDSGSSRIRRPTGREIAAARSHSLSERRRRAVGRLDLLLHRLHRIRPVSRDPALLPENRCSGG